MVRLTKKQIPWEWLTLEHIEKFGYSGTLIRALKIKSGYTKESLACLLNKRKSYIKKIENTDKVGIKLAKELQLVFKDYTDDWRIFRNRPTNEELILLTEESIKETEKENTAPKNKIKVKRGGN